MSTAPYYQKNYIGEFANDTVADARLATLVWTKTKGMIYYDTTLNELKYYNNSAWTILPPGVHNETIRFTGNGAFIADTRVDGAWIAPAVCTITRITVDVKERGKNDGGLTDNIWDVNKNGTTVYTTQANRPTIAGSAGGGESYVVATAPDVTAVAQNDRITVDTDQIVNGTLPPDSFTIIIQVVY